MPMDRDALAAAYARYSGMVHRRARQLLRNEHAAGDACHEVFLRLWQAQPTFEEVSPVTWLYQVTTNHCLNILRDARRRQALLDEHARGPAQGAADTLSLAMLLRGVPEHLHELGVYYFVDEMSQDEIALVLQISQRTVSNRLKEFRACLEKAWAPRAEEAS